MLRYEVKEARSRIEGRGAFAATAIPRRVKIGEITGELISVRKARRLARGRCRMCLIDLSTTRALDCTRGNVLRYLNHSCSPNAYLRVFRLRVEVYARRPIKKGEELTVDYGLSPHSGGMKCGCGARNCRERI